MLEAWLRCLTGDCALQAAALHCFRSGLPMTVIGKIQKFKIRDEVKNQLG
jgi:hypothetical protein